MQGHDQGLLTVIGKIEQSVKAGYTRII